MARQRLQATLTAAAFQSWIAPLRVAPPAGAAGDSDLVAAASPLVLACASKFQLDHVARRYLATIEEAVGGSVQLVVDDPANTA